MVYYLGLCVPFVIWNVGNIERMFGDWMKLMFRRHVCLLLVCCVLASSGQSTAGAGLFLTQRPETYGTILNFLTIFNDSQAAIVVEGIEEYWSVMYPNHEMTAHYSRFYSERITAPSNPYREGATWKYRFYVEIDGSARMNVEPSAHPYLQGMRLALSGMTAEESEIALVKVEDYALTLEESYGKETDFTAFYVFEYEFDYNFTAQLWEIPEPVIYVGQNIQNWKTKLIDTSGFARGYERYLEQLREGEVALWQYLWEVSSLGAPTREATYHIPSAVAYASNYGWVVPQYSYANGLGSDCANFVSYCLLSGGITEDRGGLWYPSSTAGSYAGGNWMRTGYTASVGGVVPYMRARNLFYKQNNKIVVSAGSILFYTDQSHVAFVTYADGELMIMAEHSNYTKEHRDYLFEERTVEYYGPSPYILER